MGNHSKLKYCDAVILIGGKNRRFKGKQKALATLHGKTILEHQLAILNALFDKIYLITNKPEEFKKYEGLILAEDIIKDKGPLSGIHSAVAHSKNEYVFVFAGDMPFLDSRLIQDQISLLNEKNYEAIIPRTYKGFEPLHGIYKTSIKNKLETLLKKPKVYPILAFLDDIDTYYWPLPDQKSFININTEEELNAYEKH